MNNNPLMFLQQFMQMGRNPQEIMSNLVRQNPQINMVLNQMNQSGMNSKQYVMQYAKQNNIDINPMINMMSSFGIRL